MNKLLSNTLFYGSAIIIGSVLGTAIAFSRSNTPDKIEDVSTEVAQIEENLQENDINEPISAKSDENKVETVEKKEEKPAKVQTKSVEKPVISVPQTSTTKVVPQATAQVQSKSNTQEDIWVYYMDEEKYLGLCPSQLPPEARNTDSARLNAIGIITSGPNPTYPLRSLKSHIGGWWDGYRQGKWGTSKKYMMATLSNIDDFDNTYANTRIAMFIDFNGFFVTPDNSWEEGKTINATTEQILAVDQMASDGTLYLRWLENTYNAKCPND